MKNKGGNKSLLSFYCCGSGCKDGCNTCSDDCGSRCTSRCKNSCANKCGYCSNDCDNDNKSGCNDCGGGDRLGTYVCHCSETCAGGCSSNYNHYYNILQNMLIGNNNYKMSMHH